MLKKGDNMKVNLPAKARKAVYIFTAIASPTMAYLAQQGTVTDFQFGLFSVVVTAVAGLAAINVSEQ